jgi:ribosomal protein S12 methylthiotransferase accessory factor
MSDVAGIAGSGLDLSGFSSFDLDRLRAPAETVAIVRSHFARLGITRLADQTGLDRLGIPCYAAFRPNAATLATNQGKGLTRDAAMASAVMEAAEFAIAERPSVDRLFRSLTELAERGIAHHLPRRKLPIGWQPEADARIAWVMGQDVLSGRSVLVPYDALVIDGVRGDLPPVSQSTNGLASGNCYEEAFLMSRLWRTTWRSIWRSTSRPRGCACAFST